MAPHSEGCILFAPRDEEPIEPGDARLISWLELHVEARLRDLDWKLQQVADSVQAARHIDVAKQVSEGKPEHQLSQSLCGLEATPLAGAGASTDAGLTDAGVQSTVVDETENGCDAVQELAPPESRQSEFPENRQSQSLEGRESQSLESPERRKSRQSRQSESSFVLPRKRLSRVATQFFEYSIELNSNQGFKYVFNPLSPFVIWWQRLMILLVLVVVVVAPFDVGFNYFKPPDSYQVFGSILDIFFLVDMAVHFNLAYVSHGQLVWDRCKIAHHYARSWLLLDIVANCPWDWFLGSAGKKRKFLKMAKLPRILRLVKMLCKYEEKLYSASLFMAIWLCVMTAHLCACLWAFLMLDGCEEAKTCPPVYNAYVEGFALSVAGLMGTDSWTRLYQSSVLQGTGLKDDMLIASLDIFIVLTTLTGIVCMGCVFFSVSQVLSLRTEVRQAFECRRKRVRAEMKAMKIPKELRRKVEQTYEHWELIGAQNDAEMLGDNYLSLDLRRDLAFEMYGESLRKVSMFSELSDKWLKCLAQRVQLRMYSPGDLIIVRDEIGTELFIVQWGRACVVDCKGVVLTDLEFLEGQVFGEFCFVKPGSRRSASVVSVDFSKLMSVDYAIFDELRLGGVISQAPQQAIPTTQSSL